MSSRHLTTLESLYPDALLKIVEYLSPTWIVNLWRTGSTQLRISLAKRGALTSLKLSAPTGAFSTSRLPGMISSFESLLHLSIKSSKRIAHPQRIWDCLSPLSQLKSLQLNILEVDHWMFTVIETGAALTAFCSPETLLVCHMRPISTAFPHLETLSLESTAFRPGPLQNKHVALLPPSLTSLKVSRCRGVDENVVEYLYSLPKLASLHLEVPISKPLPPSITSLQASSSRPIIIEPSYWIGSNMVELLVPLNPAAIAHLPPSITKLQVNGSQTSTLSFEHLPSLVWVNIYAIEDYEMPVFNSALETLRLNFPVRTDNLRFDSSFSNITTLFIRWKANSDLMTIFKYLGRFQQLVELDLNTSTFPVDVDCMQHLPPSLTSFTWSNQLERPASFNIDRAVERLPRGLRKLMFPYFCAALSTSFFRHLPRSLEYISLYLTLPEGASDQELGDHFSELPRSLRFLTALLYVNPVYLACEHLFFLPQLLVLLTTLKPLI